MASDSSANLASWWDIAGLNPLSSLPRLPPAAAAAAATGRTSSLSEDQRVRATPSELRTVHAENGHGGDELMLEPNRRSTTDDLHSVSPVQIRPTDMDAIVAAGNNLFCS